jgi:hypothetical protein
VRITNECSSLWPFHAPPTASLATDTATFARLCAGRIAAQTAPVAVGGELELAGRILMSLSITP